MPVSFLWAVGNQGKVYRLSVTSSQWEETQRKWHHVRGFKKISATGDCAWAIGSDHQPYIFIHSSDVPIR
jgi:tectonin beta-propeller repeat-containing protein 1